jgi:penicillin-binding protein 1B
VVERQRIIAVLRRVARMLAIAFGTLALGLSALYSLQLVAVRGRVLDEVERLSRNEYFHVIAEPVRVRVGTDVRATGVLSRLARAGLQRVRTEPGPGEVRAGAEIIEFRPYSTGVAGDRVVLGLTGNVVAQIEVDGALADEVALPAEHLTSFRTELKERRTPVPYADIPPRLIAAVLAAEDRRFFVHPGVDWRGVARAMLRNVRRGRVVEGGSTITQQTVKVILNRTRRELPAKVDEAMLALFVDRRFSKQEILQVYLNNVYMGHEGPFDVYGVAEAARTFFKKSLQDLTDSECAALAATIRAPNAASPRHNASRLQEYTRAIEARVPEVQVPDAPPSGAPARFEDASPLALEGASINAERIDFEAAQLGYYFDLLEDEWESVRKRHHIEPPATLVASVDPLLQQRSAQALDRQLKSAAKRRKSKAKEALQGAVVAMDPMTGAVRALVGGSDYATAPFNRAISISRHVGSTFKPFVYLAAMGEVDEEPRITQSSWLTDEAREYQVGQQTWAPANFDKQFRGYVTARQALEQSVNAATVSLGMDVGVEPIAALAEQVGLQERVPRNPSVILGAVETSPLRLARGYCTLANGGRTVAPYALREVRKDGERWSNERPAPRRVVSSQGAYLVTDMLVGALQYGTGASAATLGFRHLAAGKTGTSDDARDTWFVGYTPETVMSVWVGYDDNTPTGFSGSSGALPVWAAAMQAWLGDGWDASFDVPPGIAFRSVDPMTGDMANSTCPQAESAAFIEGTEPQYYCSLHAPSFGDRLDQFFGPDPSRPQTGQQPLQSEKDGWWGRFKKALGGGV